MGYVLPILLLGFVLNYQRHQNRLLGDAQFARRKKAGKIAAKYLSQAKKSISQESDKQFYNIMSKALQGFVSDKLNIDMTDFTESTVNSNLEKRGVKEEEIAEYQDCINESDFKQFSGGNVDTNEMLAFFEKSKKCLTKLEKYI